MSRPVPPPPARPADEPRLAVLLRELSACAANAEALDPALAGRLRAVGSGIAEAAPSAGEGRFRSIMDASQDAIVSADEHGRIVFFNGGAEAMFGWRTGEVLGRRLEVLMPERYRA